MKYNLKIALLSCVFILFYYHSICQDVLKANPNHVKLLQDTAGVRMLLVSLHPGDTLARHTHPAFIAYIIQGGKIEEYYPDGTKDSGELTAGMNMKSPPMDVHWDKNTGTTTIQMLMIELTRE